MASIMYSELDSQPISKEIVYRSLIEGLSENVILRERSDRRIWGREQESRTLLPDPEILRYAQDDNLLFSDSL